VNRVSGLASTIAVAVGQLPTTRYRGSKRRHAATIGTALVLARPRRLYDAFGGSGTVSVLADRLGISAQYSDIYHWTTTCARTLLVNTYERRNLRKALERVDLAIQNARTGFVSSAFDDCYFTKAENLELDGLLNLLRREESRRVHDLIFYGVAQAALAKLPMSMFHRACLKQRTADVERRAGNLAIWSTPFRVLVPRFMEEAVMFTWIRRMRHVVIRGDAVDTVPSLEGDEALFLDPPYVNPCGDAPTYAEAYHFLEGFALGEVRWRRGLTYEKSHPIYVNCTDSDFESGQGWIDGIRTLVDAGSAATILATARQRDVPGARQLGRLLRARFSVVRRRTISETTLFSEKPNKEYLFVAS